MRSSDEGSCNFRRAALTPSHFPTATHESLADVIGKQVAVRLNSGIDYRGEFRSPPSPSRATSLKLTSPMRHITAGTLSCLDGYMNIALEETTEWVGGQQKNSYGDAFIRGNNGGYSSACFPHLLRWSESSYREDVS